MFVTYWFVQSSCDIWQLIFTLLMNVCAWFMQLPSSNFFRSSGSARRGAVSGSRDAVIGSETEPSRPLTLDSNQGVLRKSFGAQRSSPIMSSEHNQTSSGRNTSNTKNLESALRGIDSLHFNDERAHY